MNSTDPKVDAFLSKADRWQEEMTALRKILLECQLTEALKWRLPCYAFEESNVVIVQGFKKYCALLFFKGVLLKDPNNVLKKTGENTRVGRQMRFTSTQEVLELEPIIKSYVEQAIDIEKAGLKVELDDADLNLPEEFLARIEEDPALQEAFEALTPGRQRAYGIYFSSAKQSKTRESRIDKCIEKIYAGKGPNER